MARALAIVPALLFFALVSEAKPSALNPLSELQCELLEFTADELVCEGLSCRLAGNANLTCGDSALNADLVILEFDKTGGFAGLEAQSDVTFINPIGTIECDQLTLERDRVQGTIRDATLTLHETRKDGSQGSKASIKGSIERIAQTVYSLSPASISLCDCGSGSLPSWSIKASSIDVDTTDRALLYFPSLWIAPFGLFEMPLIPILAPLSIPLERRAFGFLPPVLRFYDALAPGMSLPLFIPLGESWDITLSLGNRFDWTPPRLNPWAELAAPTVDARLRYYPNRATRGQAELSWVYDRFHGNALNRNDGRADALEDIRYDLQQRFNIRAHHRWTPNPSTGLFADIQWTSDDLLLSDQALKYDDRIAYYLPSRLQWFFETSRWRIEVNATHLQRLYNYDSTNYRSALNFSSYELDELSLGPRIVGYVKPINIGDWLTFDSVTEILRVGPSNFSSRVKTLWLMSQELGLYVSHIENHVEYSASQNFRFALLPTESQMQPLAVSVSRAEVGSPWRADFDSFSHTFFPAIQLANIELFTSLGGVPTYLLESDLRDTSHLLFKVGQQFRGQSAKITRLDVDVEVPFDLSSRAWLPLRLVSQFRGLGSLRSRMALTLSPRGRTFRDITASLQWNPTSKLKVGADYLLLAPNASRFQSSIWELASAESREISADGWIHGIRPKASLRISDVIALTYRADIGLPLEGAEDNDQAEIILHSLGMQLKSQCNHCWDLEVKTQIRPESTKSATDIQLQIALSLGGFEISP